MTMRTNTTVCLGGSQSPTCKRFMTKVRKSQRVTASFRVDKALLEEMSIFVRDQAGAPLYLERGSFIEHAIRRELDRLRFQIQSGDAREVGSIGNGLSRRI